MPFPTPIDEQRQIGRRDDAVGRAEGRFDCREKGFSTVQISFFVGRWSLVVVDGAGSSWAITDHNDNPQMVTTQERENSEKKNGSAYQI